jgi:hypothetical protein
VKNQSRQRIEALIDLKPAGKMSVPHGWSQRPTPARVLQPDTSAAPATDDWPLPCLRDQGIPTQHLAALGFIDLMRASPLTPGPPCKTAGI